MKNLNIIWIVIDSVRTYKTGKDDRDRLDIMDLFANESIEFTNAVTSAPSSILSASSMFTGLPANFISRHFNDWEFNENKITSLYNSLNKSGYNNYAILNSKEERRTLNKLVHPLNSKYFPKGISNNTWWSNKEVTNILENVLKKTDTKQKSFYHLWYDCRKDPTVSDEVGKALDLFKKYDLYNNSIIVINSDHGYPDPNTGLTEEVMKNYSHDMIVSDDNIKVPLFIKYPNCPKGVKINSVVGTIDIFPTICELLNIPKPNSSFKFVGKSLLGLLNNNNFQDRIIRTDTRLSMATGRITSLRSTSYKYVFNWDNFSEELFDLNKDPYETTNIINDTKNLQINTVLENFICIRNEMEKEINNFNISELTENFDINIKKHVKINDVKNSFNIIIVTNEAPESILEVLSQSIEGTFKLSRIDIICSKKISKNEKINSLFSNVFELEKFSQINLISKKYNYAFYLTENSKLLYIDKKIKKVLKKIKPKKLFLIDYNFKLFNGLLSKWIWIFNGFIKRNMVFYKEEPLMFFSDIITIVKFINKKNRETNPEEAEKLKKMALRNKNVNKHTQNMII